MTSIKFGTKAAIFGAISLSIPSLITTYRERLGINHVTISEKDFKEKISFNYQVPEFKMLSPAYSVVTHMFHHRDISHFIWNMYTLASSSLYINAGLEQTAFLFFGGGITGLLTHIFCWKKRLTLTTEPSNNINSVSIMDSLLPKELPKGLNKIIGENDYQNVADSYNNVRKQLTTKVFSLCGSSAGVYAIVGAETVQVICDLFKIIFCRTKNDEDEENSLAKSNSVLSQSFMLEGNVYSRVNWLVFEILALLQSNKNNKKDQILDVSHMNGFLFGAGVMIIWKLQNLFGLSL